MSKFDDFIGALIKGAGDVAKKELGDFADVARDDAKAFANKTRADLQRWTTAVGQGVMDEDDLNDLLVMKKAVIEIEGLKQLGIAKTKLERFRQGLIALIVDTAFDIFVPTA